MKIKPIINNIGADIKNTSKTISKSGSEGYNIGRRKSKIYKEGDIATISSVTRGVSKKLIKNASVNDLPALAGAVGLMLPIPLASVIFFGVGKAIQTVVKLVKKR